MFADQRPVRGHRRAAKPSMAVISGGEAPISRNSRLTFRPRCETIEIEIAVASMV